MDKTFFGAKALVYLKYDGALEELAKLLSRKLEIQQFDLETDIDPPHELFAWTGALGFTVWLHYSSFIEDFNYEFQIQTDMDHEDRREAELFDLSPWLAKKITQASNLETRAHSYS